MEQQRPSRKLEAPAMRRPPAPIRSLWDERKTLVADDPDDVDDAASVAGLVELVCSMMRRRRPQRLSRLR